MKPNLQQKLKNVPHKPGVYLFKKEDGGILYIGKAVNLRGRVAQYFHGDGDGRKQIPFLMREVYDFEYIVTDNEIESLMLENNLIKKHKPNYNIKLRDDKNYAFIKIDYNEKIPQIYTTRYIDTKNAKYFGPYSSAYKVRETLSLMRKIFPYCANKKVGNRPCFYYYLHRCPGVCVGKISIEEYQKTIDKICVFLSGKISQTKKEIKSHMSMAARNKEFEKAAELRNQLRSLEVVEERQKVMFTKKVNWDFISYLSTADKATVNVFVIRDGKMIDRKNFILEDIQNRSGSEIISAFMEKYYLETSELPKEIYVQEMPSEAKLLGFAIRTKICKPSRGKKLEMIELGVQNAKEYFESWSMTQLSEMTKTTLALDELGKVLGMGKSPFRMECFDISNIQGTNAVASMVVFENGKSKKSDYRKFKIRNDGTPNDFDMMREALTRRFNATHREQGTQSWPDPDLLIIDGGKGQLGIAVEVLASYGLTIPVIGLAKREEEIFKPGFSEPITLPHSNYALQLLQRIRDEAHRFAITFHKNIRSKQAFKSFLDEIPGIGPKKKKALLKKFGAPNEIKKASSEELAAVVGDKLAKEILKRA